MILFRNKLALIFVAAMLVSSIVFSGYLSSVWQRTHQQFKSLQKHEVSQLSANTHMFLKSQEALLLLLGEQLTRDKPLPHNPQHAPILDKVRATHSAFVGIGLASPEGELLEVSSNLPLDALPNLKQQEESRDSFAKTLTTNRLVVGRTYLLDFLKHHELAMALRVPIRQQDGHVKGVMTAGVRVNNPTFQANLPDYHRIDIIRDDRYFQYSSEFFNNETAYATVITDGWLNTVLHSFEQAHSTNVNFEYSDYLDIDNDRYSVEIKYDDYFQLWFMSRIPTRQIHHQFLQDISIPTSFFFISSFLLLGSASYIYRREKSKFLELSHQAFHDPLTGLANKNKLRKEIEHLAGRPQSIAFINIDRMKSINELYGQKYGDQVLIAISDRLKLLIGNNGMVARGFGDEFFVMFPCASESETEVICHRVLNTIAKPFLIDDSTILLTASIAATNTTKLQPQFDEIIWSLGVAMTEAKKSKNTVSFVNSHFQEQHLRRLNVEFKLKKAIKNREIFVVFQPQYCADGTLCGVEALARWVDEELGYIPPDLFVSVAEQSGLMNDLGELIIQKAIRETAYLHQSTSSRYSLSINVSVQQLMHSQTKQTLRKELTLNHMSPMDVVLEITESVFIEDMQQVNAMCNELVNEGFRLSLDDFGTGYSSLSSLNQLPLAELKIDKSFIDGLPDESSSELMINNILDIARNHKMTVVAEGIETLAQKQKLIEMGCLCFQGYYFAKPMESADLSELLTRQKTSVAPFQECTAADGEDNLEQ